MASWEDCKSLGERLKWVREKVLRLDSTREAERFLEGLGEAAPNVKSWATVNRYEKDERVPPVTYVAVLADRARVDLRWLATGDGAPWGGTATPPREALEALRKWMDESLPPPPPEGGRRLGGDGGGTA